MATNLDRLFRENLDQVEMTPSAEGWELVKSQLPKKRLAWVLPIRIAATITLIISVTLIVMNLDQSLPQEVLSDIDHPVEVPYQGIPSIPSDGLKGQSTESTKKTLSQKPSMVATVTPSQKPGSTSLGMQEPIEILAITGLTKPLLSNEIALPVLLDQKEEMEQPSIRITYIPSSPDINDNKGKLSKVVALAKEVTNADLLADIRDAKDQLFNRN